MKAINIKKILIIISFLTTFSTCFAQAKELKMTALMPWHKINISSFESKKALLSSHKALQQKFLKGSQSLTTFIKMQKPDTLLTINNKKRSDKIDVSQTPLSQTTPLSLNPILCSVKDQKIIFMRIHHLEKNTLLGSSHLSYSNRQWQEILANDLLPKRLSQDIQQLTQTALKKVDRNTNRDKDNFKLAIMSGRKSVGFRQQGAICLNMLVEEKLNDNFKIVSNVANENHRTLQRLLRLKSVSRNTRQIISYWQKTEQDKQSQTIETNLKMSFAESVFAKSIPTQYTQNILFSFKNSSPVIFQLDDNIISFLKKEQQSLNLNSLPKIAAINRAWVYLDKGRGWGLKMNDRVVVNDGSNSIKGHVVGYYGPEMKLNSVDNYPIREGAIVFIRKGQKKTKKGQSFIYDPKTYPTR